MMVKPKEARTPPTVASNLLDLRKCLIAGTDSMFWREETLPINSTIGMNAMNNMKTIASANLSLMNRSSESV
jgi:hypothetical protein